MRSSTAAGTEPTGWEAGSGISSVTGPRVSPAQGGSGGRKPSVFLPLRYQYRTTDPDRSRRPVHWASSARPSCFQMEEDRKERKRHRDLPRAEAWEQPLSLGEQRDVGKTDRRVGRQWRGPTRQPVQQASCRRHSSREKLSELPSPKTG